MMHGTMSLKKSSFFVFFARGVEEELWNPERNLLMTKRAREWQLQKSHKDGDRRMKKNPVSIKSSPVERINLSQWLWTIWLYVVQEKVPRSEI